MREEARRWLEQGRADLEAARKCLQVRIYYLAAFLAHQAAEKVLKALAIEKLRRMAAHSHLLTQLGAEVGVPENLTHQLRRLNPHYVVARYPDAANGVPAEMYDEAIARPLVEAAEEVERWVTSELTTLG